MTGQSEEDEGMSEERTNLAEENAQRSDEAQDNTQVADAGVPGQIQYPDRSTDAERAAAFAAGKEEFLYDPDEEPDDSDRQRRATNFQDTPEPGDETGEETEPEGVGGNPYGANKGDDDD